MTELIQRWVRDVGSLAPGVDRSVCRGAGMQLLRCWQAPQRRYHTVQHLRELLQAVDTLLSDAADAPVARVAGWFHDAVYDVRQPPGGNEAESARLSRAMLGTLGVAGSVVQQVADLVEMTADHVVTAGSALQDAFHDADLWILAAPTARFDEYCVQVRAEYAHLDDATFRRGRSVILQALARREELYRTAVAQREWSTRARANLRRELGRLAG